MDEYISCGNKCEICHHQTNFTLVVAAV